MGPTKTTENQATIVHDAGSGFHYLEPLGVGPVIVELSSKWRGIRCLAL